MPRARLPQLQSITEGSFEPNRRNPVLLGEDSFLDDHQKPIRIGESASPLSLSKSQVRVDGNFYIEGNLSNPLLQTDFDYLELRPKIYTRFTSSDYTGSLDLYVTSGDSYFLTSDDSFNFITTGTGTTSFTLSSLASGITNQVLFNLQNSQYTFANIGDASHFFRIGVGVNGASTLTTDGGGGTESDLTLDADGDIVIDAATGNITAKDNGGNYTPSSDYHIATKKYVDDNAGGSNFITDNADDTMAGTLTIDKDSTATATANVSGLLIDFDHTGICASGQTINNRAFTSVINSNSPTHVGTVNNFGIINSVISGTSGTQNNYGIYNTVVSGDKKVGIYQNVTDGGTDLQFVSSADAGDYFSIATTAHGATTIATVDDDATAADLTLDIDGDIELNADGGDITFKDDTTTLATISSTAFYTGASHFIKEAGSAQSDEAGQGQIWIKDDTPNCLAFTDDAGTDIVGIGKYHYETKFIGFYGGQAGQYIPMTGYIIEKTSSSSSNEFISFVAPYNGTIEKFIWRSEAAQDGGVRLLVYESSDGTEVPSVVIFRSDVTVDIADDIAYSHTMTSPGIGSDYSPLTKDKIYAIYLNFPATPYDTNITIVFKWDITS